MGVKLLIFLVPSHVLEVLPKPDLPLFCFTLCSYTPIVFNVLEIKDWRLIFCQGNLSLRSIEGQKGKWHQFACGEHWTLTLTFQFIQHMSITSFLHSSVCLTVFILQNQDLEVDASYFKVSISVVNFCWFW